ncbi:hypothetical protein Pmani_020302 [Petrolisthes manimaculis]|uniref:Caffeoyl-CoA O-methyltransferase n=1 Tax=Petrolisthes manimaculis TaxID=1843537 RepID=A0AAE1PHZ9_9EUCA|nr:hypothetical protein Pmani_020302 [Petrolisthes manimaculis]
MCVLGSEVERYRRFVSECNRTQTKSSHLNNSPLGGRLVCCVVLCCPSSVQQVVEEIDKMVGHRSFPSTDPKVKYTVDHSIRYTDVQKRLIEETLKHTESGMLSSPDSLQLIANLIQAIGAKKVLDVGVFTGVSSLSAALSLPQDGVVHALDINEDYTAIAKKYWDEAGVSDKIKLHIAPAADTLQKFIDEGQTGTFDFAFIDADKISYWRYYELCLVLVRRGGIIAFDNTLWNGRVTDPNDQTQSTVALRTLNEKLRDDQRINISFLNIGDVVPVNARDPTKFQHQGFGTLLMEEAERIAREEHGAHKISVISGVGTRNYYWTVLT